MLAIMNVQQEKTTVYSAITVFRFPRNLTLTEMQNSLGEAML